MIWLRLEDPLLIFPPKPRQPILEGTVTVVSSYSLESAPCPWGWGWRRAALADASPAPSLADSAAAVAPDDALSLPVPAASSWPGAPVEAEKCAQRSSANRKVLFKSPVNFCSIYFAGMGCSLPIICCTYTISPCRLISYSLWTCPAAWYRPWGVPGAEPGADGSTFRAASGTRWWVAVSGSAAASGWGAAPAAVASPTALGPSLAPASSGQCAGLAVIRVPRSAARLASRPLRPTKWIAENGKEKNRFL